MNEIERVGQVRKALNETFAPKDQDEVKVCQIAISAIRQTNLDLEGKVREAFGLAASGEGAAVGQIVQRVKSLQQSYIGALPEGVGAKTCDDLLQRRSEQIKKIRHLPEGHLLEEMALEEKFSLAIEVFSSGIPLTEKGKLEGMALFTLASPLYQKKLKDGMGSSQAAEAAVKESERILTDRLLEKVPKDPLTGSPLRHPVYIQIEGEIFPEQYERAELEKYILRTHETPYFSDGKKLSCSLENIHLDDEKQKKIDQLRESVYHTINQEALEGSERELLAAVKSSVEERDDGVPKELSIEIKKLIEGIESKGGNPTTDAALLILAYPFCEEEIQANLLRKKTALEASKKALGLLNERLEKDPVLSKYIDPVSCSLIRDPIEAKLKNGFSVYYDRTSKRALAVGRKAPDVQVVIETIQEAPTLKAYLMKEKARVCQGVLAEKGSILVQASMQEKLVEAVCLIQSFEENPITMEDFFKASKEGDLETIERGLFQGIYLNAKNKDGHTALMCAAALGHLDVVKELIAKEGIDLNAQDKNDWTALMFAASQGHLNVVKELIAKEGIDLNVKDKDGRTALIIAAANGHLDVVKELIGKEGIDLNAKEYYDGRTALMCATEKKHLDVVKELIGTAGIDLNAQDEHGRTALMLAVKNNRLDVVRELIGKEGIDLNVKDRRGRTALIIAAELGHLDMVKELIGKEGIDLNAKDKGRTALMVAAECWSWDVVKELIGTAGIDLNAQDEHGRTALMLAAERWSWDVVKELIGKEGVDLNAKDKDGRTILMVAAESWSWELVKELIGKEGIDLNAKDKDGRTILMVAAERWSWDVVKELIGTAGIDLNAQDEHGRTALMLAVKNNRLDVVRELIGKEGIDLNAQDKDGCTALMVAAELGSWDLVKELIAKEGIDLNAKGEYGRTVLAIAAERGHLDVVRELIGKEGIDLNAKSKGDWTALMYAAGCGHLDVVKELIGKEGIDLNAKEYYDGRTALMCAAGRGHLDVVKELIGTAGIDLNAKDNNGWTALMWAVANGHLDMVKELIGKAGIDLTAKDKEGRTALMIATFRGHLNIVTELAGRMSVLQWFGF